MSCARLLKLVIVQGRMESYFNLQVFIPIRYKYYFKQNLKKLNYNNLKKHFSVLFLFWDCLI